MIEEKKFVSNVELATIYKGWKGTPIDSRGRFVNEEFPFTPEFGKVWKWKTGTSPQAEEKKTDSRRLNVNDATPFFNSEENGIVWLGHASFYIRIGGVALLLDPVYYNLPFIKRYVDIPNPLAQIKTLDYLLISHDHRDHCDKKTVQQVGKLFPDVKVVTGLKLDTLLKSWLPRHDVIASGWYQRVIDTAELKLDYLPTRHWCRRFLFDTNKRLWGAFMIEINGKRIYFGGDSGYGSHYKKLAKLYDEIDIAILGIGAYSPRWFMHPSHMAPEDAVIAFEDTEAKNLLPMHYGKYDLSDEPPGEPRNLIVSQMDRVGLEGKLLLPQVGDVVLL